MHKSFFYPDINQILLEIHKSLNLTQDLHIVIPDKGLCATVGF
jgi:hypothetical protein